MALFMNILAALPIEQALFKVNTGCREQVHLLPACPAGGMG
jgi:hypothetical protein